MAELSLLGYMVALPEIDKGDDIFVVNEHTGQLWRLQVKGSTEQKRDRNYQPIVDEKQITTGSNPDRYFIFALRREMEKQWRFVVISRQKLKDRIDDLAVSGKSGGGSLKKRGKKRRTFTISFSKKTSGQVNGLWKNDMEDWSAWQPLDHEKIAADKKAAAEQSPATKPSDE